MSDKIKIKVKYVIIIYIIIIGLICIFLLMIFLPNSNDNNTPSKSENKYEKIEACIGVQGFVENRLISPSSAKFAPCYDAIITDNGDNTYTILSYVDSQNGFGAMLRTYYKVTIEDIGDKWRLKDIIIE